jgi:hypothetical protein
MSVLLQVPLDADTSLLVEADRADIPQSAPLALASPKPGRAVAVASHSLGAALDQLEPALRTIKEKLVAASPETFAVEFGVKLAGETGLILAKGTAEVNFKITMTWHRST